LGVDTTVGVYQEFSVGGYGKQLSKYADAATARADANIELAQRDALVRAYLAWLDALQARELLKLRIEALEEIREVSRIAEARLAAGRSSPGEAALAKALVGSAEASVLSARGSITQADAYLRYVCGIELHRPLEISGVLDAPPLDIDEQSIRAKVLRVAPDLKSARAEANTLSQSAILGRAGSKPFLQLGPSITREGTGDWVFLGHVRMPLPGVDPAAAENAERKLSAHIAKAKVTVLEQAVLRDVEVALHEREHALKTRDLLLHESIEPSKLAAHEARLQYEAGRSDLVSVITSRRELYDALEKWIRAAIDVQRADARLERYMDLSSQKKGQR
jgi:cobalt-zinc-cadmium efflux system outer membrane protein